MCIKCFDTILNIYGNLLINDVCDESICCLITCSISKILLCKICLENIYTPIKSRDYNEKYETSYLFIEEQIIHQELVRCVMVQNEYYKKKCDLSIKILNSLNCDNFGLLIYEKSL